MKKGFKIKTAAVAAVCLVLIVGVCIAVFSRTGKNSAADKLAQGDRFLSELDYEQAIASYEAAIEIDPKEVEAYQKLADVYCKMGDREAAKNVLERGIFETQDAELAARLEELKAEEQQEEEQQSENKQTPPEETAPPTVREDLENGGWSEDSLDENGQVKDSTVYDASGEVFVTCEYHYNETGKMIGFLLDYGDIATEWKLEPLEDGRMRIDSEGITAEGGNPYNYDYNVMCKSLEDISITYDKERNLVVWSYYHYDLNKTITSECRAINGTTVREFTYTAEGVLQGMIECDEKGRSISSTNYNSDGTVSSSLEWVRDENGNVIDTIYH